MSEVFWNRDRQILLAISYSVGLFVLMYITVYSLEAFTFYRGVGIVLLFSFVLFSGTEKKTWSYLILGLYAAGVFFVPRNRGDFNDERYVRAEAREEWDKLEEALAEAMPLCGEKTFGAVAEEEKTGKEESERDALRWANTAVLYSMEPKLICAMPAGMGVNFAMYSDEIAEEAGYLVFSLKEENLRPDWLEQSHQEIYRKYGDLLEQEYFIQYMDKEYIVYRKK